MDINELPPEIICEILNYLTFKDFNNFRKALPLPSELTNYILAKITKAVFCQVVKEINKISYELLPTVKYGKQMYESSLRRRGEYVTKYQYEYFHDTRFLEFGRRLSVNCCKNMDKINLEKVCDIGGFRQYHRRLPNIIHIRDEFLVTCVAISEEDNLKPFMELFDRWTILGLDLY